MNLPLRKPQGDKTLSETMHKMFSSKTLLLGIEMESRIVSYSPPLGLNQR